MDKLLPAFKLRITRRNTGFSDRSRRLATDQDVAAERQAGLWLTISGRLP